MQEASESYKQRGIYQILLHWPDMEKGERRLTSNTKVLSLDDFEILAANKTGYAGAYFESGLSFHLCDQKVGREKGRRTSPSGPPAAGPVGTDYVPLQNTMVSSHTATAHFGSKPLPPLDPLMML